MKKPKIRPVVRRSVAAALLRVSPRALDKLKLNCWREGRVTFYDPVQIAGLMALRDAWMQLRQKAAAIRGLRIPIELKELA